MARLGVAKDPRSTRDVRRPLPGGAPPAWVTIAALVAIVVITVALTPFQDELERAVKALLLVVPVVGAAALGGRVPGYIAAGAATIGFSMSLPPIGSPLQIAVTGDVVALIVFFLVALVVSTLVSNRIDVLAEADRQRTLLLRSVSHDLRTPLATIRAASTELLDDVEHTPEVEERLLRLVDLEAARLDRLVSNLLELNRIESGAMEPRRVPIDPEVLIRRSVERFRLAPNGVVVELDLDDELPVIQVDATQVDQVLSNLLDNAIRHSADGSPVTLAASGEGSGVRIEVADRGPGVPPEEAELVFQPFRSGTIAGSSGVGLAISRAIVERHGGTISVDDRPGGGARFVVTFPAG
ncbi:sensor histidine kinase [Dermatobacter hominis]|uniref:sensor histidine kinase n=1 Tax=Dermatobacter hominis TaxID=2884263 RepID=UPI001D120956|nr:ATP-binding protein [Dermatobacter hominis]UDY37086.1 PAS domain-containing sensor histidine kinase [Dermatobacter hominis]